MALLVEAAPAHRKLRLARVAMPRQPRCAFRKPRHRLLDPPRVRHVGLALEHADLLLMRLSAMPFDLARLRRLVARGPALPPVFLVDPALRIGIVLKVAFKCI